jgi:dihydrofolate reductase
MDEARIIGRDGLLPWHLPEDMAHFKALTMGGVVVMGRKTWDSLPARFRPLPGRINVVVTRNPDVVSVPEGVHLATSVESALEISRRLVSEQQRIWIIGGAEIYRTTLPVVDEVHLTQVHGVHEGDASFPPFEEEFELASQRSGEACDFKVYRRT